MNRVERTLRKADQAQQRHTASAFCVGVVKKFGDDNGSVLAATMAHAAFASVFPLLLVLVTVLGLVAAGSPSFRQAALHAVADQVPLIGHELRSNGPQLRRSSDIGLIVGSIMGAVFFTLLLLSGNTMMQAVRERTSELAVLKTIGFSSHSVLAMVLAESVLLLLLGGVLGLALAMLMVGGIQSKMGGAIPMAPVDAGIWTHGLLLMVTVGLLVGALPAIRAMRLNIVDALAGR